MATRSPLFQNGLDAITTGIEDYQAAAQSNSTRRLASAIRNVASGTLLIAKEKLRQLSANAGEYLIYEQVAFKADDAGVLTPVKKGKKTVDVRALEYRLKDAGVEIPRWHEEVVRLTDIRNNVEHLHMQHPDVVAREAIACATAFLRDFLRRELATKPEEVFPSPVVESMNEIIDASRDLETSCRQNRMRIELALDSATQWFHEDARCGVCGSHLVVFEGTVLPSVFSESRILCRACGTASSAETFVETAIGRARRRFTKDDLDRPDPVAWCEQCSSMTFVVDDDACYLCGQSRQYLACLRCGNGLSAEEQCLDGLCSWCAHMGSKDD